MPLPLPSSTLTRVAAVVGSDEVGLAVAVDVRHRHRIWSRAGGEGWRWLWKAHGVLWASGSPARSRMVPLSTRFSPSVPLPAMPLTVTV